MHCILSFLPNLGDLRHVRLGVYALSVVFSRTLPDSLICHLKVTKEGQSTQPRSHTPTDPYAVHASQGLQCGVDAEGRATIDVSGRHGGHRASCKLACAQGFHRSAQLAGGATVRPRVCAMDVLCTCAMCGHHLAGLWQRQKLAFREIDYYLRHVAHLVEQGLFTLVTARPADPLHTL